MLKMKIKITDTNGNRVELEVTDEVYRVLVESDEAERRHMSWARKHLDDRALEDVLLVYQNGGGLDERYIEEEVRTAERRMFRILQPILDSCTQTQRRRFRLYCFQGLSFAEIARRERCDESTVRGSVNTVIKKLRGALSADL